MSYYLVAILLPVLFYYIQVIGYNSLHKRITTGNISSGYKMMKILFYVTYNGIKILIIQWLNQNIIYIKDDEYIIQFIINGTIYKKFIKIEDNDNPIIQVLNDEEDVTEYVEPYFNSFYFKRNLTCKNLKYKTLTFNTLDGEDKTFTENELITL